MDIFYITCYIIIGIIFILMIRRIILNIKINKLNTKCVKLFHYFALPLLTGCRKNEHGLHVGQIFRRYYDYNEKIGYKLLNMEFTIMGYFYDIDNKDSKALILKRLYIVPTEIVMDTYIKGNIQLDEDNLINKESIYFEYNEDLHTIELFCGKDRLEEMEANNSLRVIHHLNLIMSFLYKECSMKKRSVSPLVADFYTYLDFLKGDTNVK